MRVFAVNEKEYALITADLMRADRFLRVLDATDPAGDGKVVREAPTLAAIVSYCRPFKTSRDAAGWRRRWIPQGLVHDPPSGLRTFHGHLVKNRDQGWAHADWAAHTPRSYPGDTDIPVAVSRNPWVPMTHSEIAQFQQLVHEVDHRLQPRSAR